MKNIFSVLLLSIVRSLIAVTDKILDYIKK